jgi:protoheme IX farnesyltransferase
MSVIASDAVICDVSELTSDPLDYWRLLKPRVMSLVIFTGFVGMWCAPAGLPWPLALTALLCLAVGSGAAGALNMWYERDLDALMERTKNRPLPQNRLDPNSALGFGVALSIGSVGLMGLAVNIKAAGLLAFSILFYVFVYTMWLKPRTPQNIVIGGVPGAMPPLIGWVAMTDAYAWEPFVFFLITFVWTAPHFWSLAITQIAAYKHINMPMLPVTHGVESTKKHILFYTLLLVLVSLLPYGLSDRLGVVYLIGAITLNGWFGYYVLKLYFGSGCTNTNARKSFFVSIWYLFAIYVLWGVAGLV